LSPEQVEAELAATPGIPVVTNGHEGNGSVTGSSEIPKANSDETAGALQKKPSRWDGQTANQHREDLDDADDPDYTSQDAEEDLHDEQEIDYNSFHETEPSDSGYWDSADKADHPLSLFVSLRVYLMADRYGVPPLKLLALDRFYRTAECFWMSFEDFPSVVDEIYTSTPDTDIAMREIVCRLVANDYWNKDAQERMSPIMRKHGDFAVGVLHYMMKLWHPATD
jgi:hypothetical protein